MGFGTIPCESDGRTRPWNSKARLRRWRGFKARKRTSAIFGGMPLFAKSSWVWPPGCRRRTTVEAGKQDVEGTPEAVFSEEMLEWLRAPVVKAKEEISAKTKPGSRDSNLIATVADGPDPNESTGIGSDDEFVIDEVVLDEFDEFELIQEPPFMSPESEPDPSTRHDSIPAEKELVKSVGETEVPPAAARTGLLHWRSAFFGAALLVALQWLWTTFVDGKRAARRTGFESDGMNGTSPQSLEALKSLPFGVQTAQDCESVEWVNMCWRKAWRVYQRGLERWLSGLLQPLFDNLVEKGSVPDFVQRLRILELTFDHEAPCLSNMRRRPSRKDSDLNGVVDIRYTGGARMLLMLEVGGGGWKLQVPVLVSDLDIECRLWHKIRLAPLSPYLGTISLAFVAPPNIKVQLSPYNSVRLMRVPVLQNFLKKFLTEDLPSLMVLPKRLEINIPPAVTAVAEAAVGRDAVMKAVASAVLQADVVEQSLTSALPLGPQGAAGGIRIPESFQGELSVTLIQGRNLPVWGFPWQSNPYCRLTLGKQAVMSKRESDTSYEGSHRNPLWNQEFEFLVEDTEQQVLEIFIKDSHITGRPEVGKVELPLRRGVSDQTMSVWLPVQAVNPGQLPSGELHIEVTYKPFIDDEQDSGFREAENRARDRSDITDVKSAAAASSKAAAAAAAAFAAIAMTKAATARAAHRAQQAAAKKIANLGSGDRSDEEEKDDKKMAEDGFDPDTYDPSELLRKRVSEAIAFDDFDDFDEFDEDEDEEGEYEDFDEEDESIDKEKEAPEPVAPEEFRKRTPRTPETSASIPESTETEPSEAGASYDDAKDLEASELKNVLKQVEADLGEDIGNVIAAEELASQLKIVKSKKEGKKDDGTGGAVSWGNSLELSQSDESKIIRTSGGSSSASHDDGMDKEELGADSESETPAVSESQDSDAEESLAAVKPTTSNPFVFHGSDFDEVEPADVEPAEAVALPFPSEPLPGMSGSVGENGAALPSSHFLEDVKASVNALESTIERSKPAKPKLALPEVMRLGGGKGKDDDTSAPESLSGGGRDVGVPVDSGGGDVSGRDNEQPTVGEKRKRDDVDSEASGKGQWWTFLIPWGRKRTDSPEDDGKEAGASQDRQDLPEPSTSSSEPSPGGDGSGQEKGRVPWWAAIGSVISFRRRDSGSEEAKPKRKRQKTGKSKRRRTNKNGPNLSSMPIDLPLAEIAREVAKMREEQNRKQEGLMDDLQAQNKMESSDRKWIMLLCFLTACSAGLLTVVAYRLDHFG
ncbi:hypothetical protein BSKO_02960 [Bryopsis sp. KO-2023]|nr:hypothetical protein BSKO_02960 [Bryopsis sp. KO-2023]